MISKYLLFPDDAHSKYRNITFKEVKDATSTDLDQPKSHGEIALTCNILFLH